jgi:hypothetical protein
MQDWRSRSNHRDEADFKRKMLAGAEDYLSGDNIDLEKAPV